jgi:hypothetical protein
VGLLCDVEKFQRDRMTLFRISEKVLTPKRRVRAFRHHNAEIRHKQILRLSDGRENLVGNLVEIYVLDVCVLFLNVSVF